MINETEPAQYSDILNITRKQSRGRRRRLRSLHSITGTPPHSPSGPLHPIPGLSLTERGAIRSELHNAERVISDLRRGDTSSAGRFDDGCRRCYKQTLEQSALIGVRKRQPQQRRREAIVAMLMRFDVARIRRLQKFGQSKVRASHVVTNVARRE